MRARREVLCGMLAALTAPGAAECQTPSTQEHTAWVANVLEAMLRVEPGQTREQLLKVFTTEGGIFTALQRTYVSRECPFFKVDVTFHPVGRPAHETDRRALFREDGRDVIATISRPYLQFSVVD